MRSCIVTLLFCISGCIHEQITVENCGRSTLDSEQRIVGGQPVTPGEFPWMVTLHQKTYGYHSGHICGGSILNEHWILTAAHCVNDNVDPHKYEVFVGLHKLSKKDFKHAKRHQISKIIVHKEYDYWLNENDIALLRVSDPIDFSGSEGFVNGICLPEENEEEPHPGTRATAVGWGETESESTSDVLRSVEVAIIPTDYCNEQYTLEIGDDEPIVTNNMLCAGVVRKDSCQGDSGGPLTVQRNGVAVQIGIVSFGDICGIYPLPGVYMRVSAYIDWIKKNIN